MELPADLLNDLPQSLRSRFLSAKTEKEQRNVLDVRIRQLTEKLWPLNKNIANKLEELSIVQRKHDAWEEIDEFAAAPEMQRLGESCFHKLVEATANGTVILPTERDTDVLKGDFRWVPNEKTAVFVVQHDWASAFANATDFADGDFRVPYDDAVFEFRISGHRVCCCIGSQDGEAGGYIFYIETAAGWALAGYNEIADSKWERHLEGTEICANIFNLIRGQVRAICIALDAEIATTEVVRAPHKLNKIRERKGRTKLFDFHLVSLARKTAKPLPADDPATEHYHKRLHFVRGHWRHFETRKTWVRWHLRGDPNLGFIEKSYLL